MWIFYDRSLVQYLSFMLLKVITSLLLEIGIIISIDFVLCESTFYFVNDSNVSSHVDRMLLFLINIISVLLILFYTVVLVLLLITS